jgi:uncharacterized membrane-anchored protein YhcB (DUF1043 family)
MDVLTLAFFVIEVLLGIVVGFLAWWGNSMQVQIKETEKELNDVKITMASSFVTKVDMTEFRKEIAKDFQDLKEDFKEGVREIKDILKEKADKVH